MKRYYWLVVLVLASGWAKSISNASDGWTCEGDVLECSPNFAHVLYTIFNLGTILVAFFIVIAPLVKELIPRLRKRKDDSLPS